MVTFKCKRSGNKVSFTNENDIAQLRKHEGYLEIKEVQDEEVKEEKADEKRQVLSLPKRGRPKKNSL